MSAGRDTAGVMSMLRALAMWSLVVLVGAGAAPTASCRICFYGPDNIAFGKAGEIYIVDTDGKARSRVVQLDVHGGVVRQWDGFCNVRGTRNGPEGIAVRDDGSVLVTDAGCSRIRILERSGQSGVFANRVPFHDLGHIAISRTHAVYVAEGGPRVVYKLSDAGTVLARWHRPKGSNADSWSYTESIAVQPNGNVVLEDWANRRIEILAADGRTLHVFGSAGTHLGQFQNTAGLAVDAAGNIYVADVALHRLQEFDPNGKPLRAIQRFRGQPIFTDGPSSIAVDASGSMYAADGPSVVKLTSGGVPVRRWN